MNESQPRIIDCFLFNNELDLLEIRLNEMSSFVDLFILVEANKTLLGDDKPYFYEENKARFEKFNEKILHLKIDDLPVASGPGDFTGEHYQRNSIGDTIHYLYDQGNLKKEDIVFISDVDEIPFMEDLMIEFEKGIQTPTTLGMDLRLYYLNMSNGNLWQGTVIASVQDVIAVGSQWFRDERFDFPVLNNGWHFTWCGGWDAVLKKIENIVDAKEAIEEQGLSMEQVKDNFDEGVDLFSRDGKSTHKVQDLPKFVADNPHLYEEYINAE